MIIEASVTLTPIVVEASVTLGGIGGSIATDVIWDAAGDLAVGAGANTAARLAIGTSLQVLRVNSGATNLEWASPAGGGDALVANPLSQFAATTSAQLAGVISDETGTGALVFATSPTFVNPYLGTPLDGNLQFCNGYSYNDLDDLPNLGTLATQAANNVAITGGSISGITDLAVADGGTGASDAATARTNLGAHPLTIGVGSALGTSGTVDLDFSTLISTYQTIALTGNITFTTSNRASGRGVTLRISATGTPRTIGFPGGWKFFGSGFPVTLDESELLVTLFCFGTADSDVVAAVAEAV